jgi:uncharacterized protein YggE
MRWIVATPIMLLVLALIPAMAPVVTPAAAQTPEGDHNQIVTSGNGTVTVAPDQATVSVGAQAQHANAAEAMAEVGRTANQILARWQQLGIRREDIRTSSVQVFPIYNAPREGAPQITGYRASYALTVTLNNMNLVGSSIDAAMAAGANVVQGITFGLRDSSSSRTEALAMAVREARQKAEAIAAAAGLRIRGIDRIVEGNVAVQVREMRAAQTAPGSTPIEPGNVIVTAQLTVVFTY